MKILILDFDKTFLNKHCRGRPMSTPLSKAIDTTEEFGGSVRKAQTHFKTHPARHVFVCSTRMKRGFENSIQNPTHFVETQDPITPQNIGAYKHALRKLSNHYEHIFINTRGLESEIKGYLATKGLERYFKDIFGAKDMKQVMELDWPRHKTSVLLTLKDIYNLGFPDVHFFDDSPKNIGAAQKEGFQNAVLATVSGVPLLEEILKLFDEDYFYTERQVTRPMMRK